MGVEVGPSGAVSVGNLMGNFPTIVNEGPVSAKALENTMTVAKFNPIGEIVFKPGVPSVIEQAEAVAAAAWEKIELVPQETVVVLPRVEPAVFPQTEPAVLPKALPQVEPAPALQVSPAPKTEVRVSNRISQAVSPQPLLQEVEEVVEEKIRVDEPKESLEEEEEIEKTNRKFVVDERTLSQVVLEIKAAARKAGVLAGKLGIKITGKLIGSFLPVQHPGNESEAVKGKGPDGSIPERQQTIEEQGEYISVLQAEENAVKVAYEKPPIKIRPEGESVKDEVVEIVFRDHIAKPKTVAVEIIRKRIVKKKVQVLARLAAERAGPAAVEAKTETSLKDYPELEKVFGRAA